MINTVIYSKPHNTNGGNSVYVVNSSSRQRTDNNLYDDIKNSYNNNGYSTADGRFMVLNAEKGYITYLEGKTLDYAQGNIKSLATEDLNAKKAIMDDAKIRQAIIDELTSTNITTEYLTVTKQAHFFELIVDKIKSVGGQIILTPTNCILDFTEAYDSNDTLIPIDTLNSSNIGNVEYFRVFWRSHDPVTGRSITNDWVTWDQALCQSFNDVRQGVNQNVSNKYYWRLVTNVSDMPALVDMKTQTVIEYDSENNGDHSADDYVQYGFSLWKGDINSNDNEVFYQSQALNDELDLDMTQTMIGSNSDITLKVEKLGSGSTPFAVATGHNLNTVGLQVATNAARRVKELILEDIENPTDAQIADAEETGALVHSIFHGDWLCIELATPANNYGAHTQQSTAEDINVAVIFLDNSYMIFPSGTATKKNGKLYFDISQSNSVISKIIVYRNGHSELEYCHWIDLSNVYIAKSGNEPTVAASNSGCDYMLIPEASIPEGGDNLCQLGFRYNEAGKTLDENGLPTDTWSTKRASAIILTAYNSIDKGYIDSKVTLYPLQAPAYAQYQYIKDFNLGKYRGTFFDATGGQIAGDVEFAGTLAERLKIELENNTKWSIAVYPSISKITPTDSQNPFDAFIGTVFYYTPADSGYGTLRTQSNHINIPQALIPYNKQKRPFIRITFNSPINITKYTEVSGAGSYSIIHTNNTTYYTYNVYLPFFLSDETTSTGDYSQSHRPIDDICPNYSAEMTDNAYDHSSLYPIQISIAEYFKRAYDVINRIRLKQGQTIWGWQDNFTVALGEIDRNVTWTNDSYRMPIYSYEDDTIIGYFNTWSPDDTSTMNILDYKYFNIINITEIAENLIYKEKEVITIYKKTNTGSVEDIGGAQYQNGIPDGWSETMPSINMYLGESLWVSTATKWTDRQTTPNTVTWSGWSKPVKLSGDLRGTTVTTLYCKYANSSGTPPYPTFSPGNLGNVDWTQTIWQLNPEITYDEQTESIWMTQSKQYWNYYANSNAQWAGTSEIYEEWVDENDVYHYRCWSDPIRITGLNGSDIKYIYHLSEYETLTNAEMPDQSATGTPTGWTDTPSGVSLTYKYEWVSVKTLASGNSQWTNWSTPALWSVFGEDGKDGADIEYIYYLAGRDENNPPPNPTSYININDERYQTDGYIPTIGDFTWYDNPKAISENYPLLYVSIRKKLNGVWGAFSDPVIWARWTAQGLDGKDVVMAFLKGSTLSTPTKPEAGHGVLYGIPSNNDEWGTGMPQLTQLESHNNIGIWMSQTYSWWDDNAEHFGGWTDPIVISGEDGVNGEDGIKIEFIYKVVGPEDLNLTTNIHNNVTGATVPASLNPNLISTSADNKTFQDDDFVPTGWTDDPHGVSAEWQFELMSQREKKRNSQNIMEWGQWTDPVIWSKWGINGMDAVNTEYIFSNTVSANPTPEDWASNTTYQQDEYIPTGWTDEPVGVSQTHNFEYVCLRKKIDKVWRPFSEPTIWAQWTELGMEGSSYKIFYIVATIQPVQVGSSSFNIVLPQGAARPNASSSYTVSSRNWVPTGWSSSYPNYVSNAEQYAGSQVLGEYERICMIQCKMQPLHDGTFQYSNFSDIMIISGAQGLPGADGTEIEFIYARTRTPDNTPRFTNVTNNTDQIQDWGVGRSTGLTSAQGDTTWSDNPRGIGWELSINGRVPDYQVEWMCQRYYREGHWSAFTQPVVWSKWGVDGKDGDGIEYVFLLSQNTIVPDLDETGYSVGNNTYVFSKDDFLPKYTASASLRGNTLGEYKTWTDQPQGVDATWKYEFVSVRNKVEGRWGHFSTPKIWSRYALDNQRNGYILLPKHENVDIELNGNITLDVIYDIVNITNSDTEVLGSNKFYTLENTGDNFTLADMTEYAVIGAFYNRSNQLMGIIVNDNWKNYLNRVGYNGPTIISTYIDAYDINTGVCVQWPLQAASRFGDYWAKSIDIDLIDTLPHHVIFSLYKVASGYNPTALSAHNTYVDTSGLELLDARTVIIQSAPGVSWKKTDDSIEMRITGKQTEILEAGFRDTQYYNLLTETASAMERALGQLTTLTDANGTITDAITNLNNFKQTAEGNFSTITKQISSFNNVTGELEERITNTNNRIDTATESIRTLSSTVSTQDISITNLNNRVSTAEGNISTISSTVDDHTTSINEVKETANSFSRRITSIENAGYTTSSQVTSLIEQNPTYIGLSTSFTDLKNQLKTTGIDIENGKITLTADNTILKNVTGSSATWLKGQINGTTKWDLCVNNYSPIMRFGNTNSLSSTTYLTTDTLHINTDGNNTNFATLQVVSNNPKLFLRKGSIYIEIGIDSSGAYIYSNGWKAQSGNTVSGTVAGEFHGPKDSDSRYVHFKRG